MCLFGVNEGTIRLCSNHRASWGGKGLLWFKTGFLAILRPLSPLIKYLKSYGKLNTTPANIQQNSKIKAMITFMFLEG